jgi:hypothetical protein
MEREWRCKKCNTHLGVERGARLHLRYKEAQYVRYRAEGLGAWIAEHKAQSAAHQSVMR